MKKSIRTLLIPDNPASLERQDAIPTGRRIQRPKKRILTLNEVEQIPFKTWLTMGEAEAYLGVSRWTVSRRLQEGIIKGKKTTGVTSSKSGGRWRISRASIDKAYTDTREQFAERVERLRKKTTKR